MAPREEERDLGFGTLLVRESRTRLLNRDGSFNVARTRTGFGRPHSAYQYLLTVSWPRFLAILAAVELGANALFGLVYLLLGPGALERHGSTGFSHRYWEGFFFSVHTLSTIGYGNVSPVGMAANVVVTVESLLGLLGFSLAAGLVFARFARPVVRVVFSDQAVIAPYQGGTGFMFRIANGRTNDLIEVEAKVSVSLLRQDGSGMRDFHELSLERDRVALLPLAWTVVHPLVPGSPLYGMTEEMLHAADAEFLVLLAAVDETFAQTVHARSSYKPDEIVWGARFTSPVRALSGGVLSLDINLLSDYERVPLPDGPAAEPVAE
jgi:inward rectifier potassium channel